MNSFDRFAALWSRHETGQADSRVRDVHDELIAMYGEPWRTYHNFDHISSCLGWLDLCKAHAEDPDSIEMAIWFHDCVYRVGAPDNEARSRELFLERSDGELEDGFRKKVARLIMDTCHRNKPESPDGQLLADIDLTNFGLHWNEYIVNSINVRKEMENPRQVPLSSSRPEFLELLLARKTIYYSPYYRQHHEAQARENIKKHLSIWPEGSGQTQTAEA